MEQPGPLLAHKLVALVEDEPIVRDIATVELEDHGFDVIEFATADEALPFFDQHGADVAVLITDVQMPGRLSGLDLIAILARRWPRLQMLVTSGGPLVDPGRLPPAVRFLAKPWRPADMAARVEELALSAA
jgi:two-component system, response regulator PdtaR